MKKIEPFTELGQRLYTVKLIFSRAYSSFQEWDTWFDKNRSYLFVSKVSHSLCLNDNELFFFTFEIDSLKKLEAFISTIDRGQLYRERVSYTGFMNNISSNSNRSYYMNISLRMIYPTKQLR